MNPTTETTTSEPIYLRGCRITAGARAGPPPPSWRTAKMLVLARRASSRIMKPAAATSIQKAYRRARNDRATKIAAANTIIATWRIHADRVQRESCIIKLQSAVRRHQAMLKRTELLAQLLPCILRIQATARGIAIRKHAQKMSAAACLVQASWRMVRSQVVGRRLAGATARLQAGGLIAKYPKGGLSHERHERFMWLSKDRKKLCWTSPATKDARSSEADKSVSMLGVTAVSDGLKTTLLKKMGRRADAGAGRELMRTPAELLGGRARPLDAACAFSLIGSDRVLDLVAPDEGTRSQWLRDLRTLLVYGHHLDHEAAVGAIEAGMRRGSLADPAAAAA